jgi:hypothetical protein
VVDVGVVAFTARCLVRSEAVHVEFASNAWNRDLIARAPRIGE